LPVLGLIPLLSVAVGVGQRSTWALSFGSPLELILPFFLFTASSETGVCQSLGVGKRGDDPESIAEMRSPTGGSG
jgi:hypothetical protein